MIEKSPAKINLFLYVLKKRQDGYHELYSLMHKIDFFDYIRIKKTDKFSIEILTNKRELNNEKNLAYKAAKLFFENTKIRPQVFIEIEKHIPMGSGLGGGSSNAAYTLKILNELFDFPLTDEKLHNLSAMIGSDVPFFLCKKPAAIARGRGEILTPVECDTENYSVFLAIPDINVSTALIYSKLLLTSGKPINKMPFVVGVGNCSLEKIKLRLRNDLEKVALAEFEELREIKRVLFGFFGNALLSGSGASIFSIINPEVRAGREVEDFLVSKGMVLKTANFSKKGR